MNEKQYLFYTQHETDDNGRDITALYLTPKEPFVTKGICGLTYDAEDKAMIQHVRQVLGFSQASRWILEGYGSKPPEIIKWITNEENRKIFSTTDKFAQLCKDGGFA